MRKTDAKVRNGIVKDSEGHLYSASGPFNAKEALMEVDDQLSRYGMELLGTSLGSDDYIFSIGLQKNLPLVLTHLSRERKLVRRRLCGFIRRNYEKAILNGLTIEKYTVRKIEKRYLCDLTDGALSELAKRISIYINIKSKH